MKRLRAPGGCPWDREQTPESLKPFVIEEAYEVVAAIDEGDAEGLKEELGDLLLQVVFLSEVMNETRTFDVYDTITSIHDKLIRRHPHVFGDAVANDSEAVLTNWEKLKRTERGESGSGTLSGVPPTLPALLKATRLTEKAARVGFDWRKTDDIFVKMEEEIAELRLALASNDRKNTSEEVGDLLFTVANLARRLEINAEEALQSTNRKFTRRFETMEKTASQRGVELDSMTLEELDALWNNAK